MDRLLGGKLGRHTSKVWDEMMQLMNGWRSVRQSLKGASAHPRCHTARERFGVARWRLVLGMFALSCTPLATAAELGAPIDDPKVQTFIKQMAKKHGLDRAELDALFSEAVYTQKVLDAFSRTAESKPWRDYRKIFIKPNRIEGGAEFWAEHRVTLERMTKTYGVPAEFVVAIIGVETLYGKYRGRIRVLDALTTLAFNYPRRAKFFRGELEAFLLLRPDLSVSLTEVKGSYAGAMGFGQFIPTSYRAYAVDFDGDGRRDLLASKVDAIGSVGNYLKRHRWTSGGPLVRQVRGVNAGDKRLAERSLKRVLAVRDLKQTGVRAVNGDFPNGKVAMFSLRAEGGTEIWVGYQNFYAITRYNPSKLYAMAVVELANAIKVEYARRYPNG